MLQLVVFLSGFLICAGSGCVDYNGDPIPYRGESITCDNIPDKLRGLCCLEFNINGAPNPFATQACCETCQEKYQDACEENNPFYNFGPGVYCDNYFEEKTVDKDEEKCAICKSFLGQYCRKTCKSHSKEFCGCYNVKEIKVKLKEKETLTTCEDYLEFDACSKCKDPKLYRNNPHEKESGMCCETCSEKLKNTDCDCYDRVHESNPMPINDHEYHSCGAAIDDFPGINLCDYTDFKDACCATCLAMEQSKEEPKKPEVEPKEPEHEPKKPEEEPKEPEKEPKEPEEEPKEPEEEPKEPEEEPKEPEEEPKEPEEEPKEPEEEDECKDTISPASPHTITFYEGEVEKSKEVITSCEQFKEIKPNMCDSESVRTTRCCKMCKAASGGGDDDDGGEKGGDGDGENEGENDEKKVDEGDHAGGKEKKGKKEKNVRTPKPPKEPRQKKEKKEKPPKEPREKKVKPPKEKKQRGKKAESDAGNPPDHGEDKKGKKAKKAGKERGEKPPKDKSDKKGGKDMGSGGVVIIH